MGGARSTSCHPLDHLLNRQGLAIPRQGGVIYGQGDGRLMEFDVVLEEDEDGTWVVTVPALPGCLTQGDTMEEALQNAKEAIQLHLEDATPIPIHAVRVAKVHVEG